MSTRMRLILAVACGVMTLSTLAITLTLVMDDAGPHPHPLTILGGYLVAGQLGYFLGGPGKVLQGRPIGTGYREPPVPSLRPRPTPPPPPPRAHRVEIVVRKEPEP